MRKSRVKISAVEEKVLADVGRHPAGFFVKSVPTLKITVPDWAMFALLILNYARSGLELCFCEDAKDFFLLYTKKSLRNDDNDIEFVCFKRSEQDWFLFVPPTLIGTNLKTKIRKKQ